MASAIAKTATSAVTAIIAIAQLGTVLLVLAPTTVAEESATAKSETASSATAFDPVSLKPQTIPAVPDAKALLCETAPPFNQQLLGGVQAK